MNSAAPRTAVSVWAGVVVGVVAVVVELSKGAGAGALTAGAATGVPAVPVCGDELEESEPPPQATRITPKEARRTERIVDSVVILQTSIRNEKGSFLNGDRIREQ